MNMGLTDQIVGRRIKYRLDNPAGPYLIEGRIVHVLHGGLRTSEEVIERYQLDGGTLTKFPRKHVHNDRLIIQHDSGKYGVGPINIWSKIDFIG